MRKNTELSVHKWSTLFSLLTTTKERVTSTRSLIKHLINYSIEDSKAPPIGSDLEKSYFTSSIGSRVTGAFLQLSSNERSSCYNLKTKIFTLFYIRKSSSSMFCPTLEIRTYDHEYSMFVILVFEVRKSKIKTIELIIVF